MTLATPIGQLLLIDDREDHLSELVAEVEKCLPSSGTITTWRPMGDGDPRLELEKRLVADTVLVVTDYDLSTSLKGLFGPTIVDWCKARYIPVGNFSRETQSAISTYSDPFEIRISPMPEDAAPEIARIFSGFAALRDRLADVASQEPDTPATALAMALGVPGIESELAPYFVRTGEGSGALLSRVVASARSSDDRPSPGEAARLLLYVTGHVLLNAIMRFPGPILGEAELCAYVCAAPGEAAELTSLFDDARYDGPFADGQSFFWRERIDNRLDEAAPEELSDEAFEYGGYNRAAVTACLGREPQPHSCDRCAGMNGGFWCPFSERAVCERADCSVPSSSWIPPGTALARVEKDFYDEWAPLLGF